VKKIFQEKNHFLWGIAVEPTDEKPLVDTETSSNVDKELRLQVGDTLHLEIVSDLTEQRHPVKVIGYAPGLSIVVTTPRIEKKVRLVQIGQTVNIRLMGARRIIGFRSSVIRTLFTPYPHLHLSYPKELSSIELRRTQRVTVNIVAAIKNEKFSGEPIPAIFIDLSAGGGLLESDFPLGAMGDALSIAIRLQVAEQERYLSLSAKIHSIQPAEGISKISASPRSQHGIEFLAVPPDNRLVLYAFVYEQIVASLLG